MSEVPTFQSLVVESSRDVAYLINYALGDGVTWHIPLTLPFHIDSLSDRVARQRRAKFRMSFLQS